MSVFDYIKSINNKSQQLDDLDDYVAYVINTSFSLYEDTLFHANTMNINHHLSKDLQYDYYYNSIRKKNRYTPWPKKIEKDEDLSCISQYYKYNMRRSLEAYKILNSSQRKKIKERILGGNE